MVPSEHSSKELSEQRVNSYLEHMSAQPVENARDISIFYVASPLRGLEIEFESRLGTLPDLTPEEVLYGAETMRTTRGNSTRIIYKNCAPSRQKIIFFINFFRKTVSAVCRNIIIIKKSHSSKDESTGRHRSRESLLTSRQIYHHRDKELLETSRKALFTTVKKC